MANGFTINALLNPSKWLRGVKSMEDSLDDLEGALEDANDEVKKLDREGERSMESIEDGAEDAAKEVSDLEKRLRDVRDTGKKVGDDTKRGFDKAKDGAAEFKDEANSTAREAAASFDGSAESIGDAFQEVAANAFGGFGPAGAVAGIAAAAGIGLAVAGFEDVQAKQEELQELTKEWSDTYMEEGSEVLSTATIIAKGLEILSEKQSEVTENAELWGVAEQTAVAAMAGSPAALDEVAKALDRKREASEKDAQAAQETVEANGGQLLMLTPLQQEYNKATEAFNKHVKAQKDGAKAVDTMSYFLKDQVTAAEDATVQVDELGNAVYTLPGGKQIYVDAKTGVASENIDNFKGDLNTIPKSKATNVYANVGQAQRDVDTFVRNNNGKQIYVNVQTRFGRAAI